MDEDQPENTRNDRPGPEDGMEQRSATQLVIGLGGPALLAGGHIVGKLLDRPAKEQPPKIERPAGYDHD